MLDGPLKTEKQQSSQKSVWTRRRLLKQGGMLAGTALLLKSGLPAYAESGCEVNCEGEASTWDISKLREYLQHAIKVELFTIPPYLCGLYSLKDTSSEAYVYIQSVLIEEMLHVQLAGNMLTAIGGHPRLTGDSAVCTYPSAMPFRKPGFTIGLAPVSCMQMEKFVEIELPDYKLEEGQEDTKDPAPCYYTIGRIYAALESGLEQVSRITNIFTGPLTNQVTTYGRNDTTVIDFETAKQAIKIIVSQGEGDKKGCGDRPEPERCGVSQGEGDETGRKPVVVDEEEEKEECIDINGNLPHYWKFKELAKHDDNYWKNKVHQIYDGSLSPRLENLSSFFDGCYSWVLTDLELGFNGGPVKVGKDIGSLMFQVIKPLAVYMISGKAEQKNIYPQFKYRSGVTLGSLQDDWNKLDCRDKETPELKAVAQVLGLTV
jgi:hypothetical protein